MKQKKLWFVQMFRESYFGMHWAIEGTVYIIHHEYFTEKWFRIDPRPNFEIHANTRISVSLYTEEKKKQNDFCAKDNDNANIHIHIHIGIYSVIPIICVVADFSADYDDDDDC